MRGAGAWLGIAVCMALAGCETTDAPGAFSFATGGTGPSRIPASPALGGPAAVGNTGGTGTSPSREDCSLPSFALIDAGAAVPWACLLEACAAQVAACAGDCACNSQFTEAVQCMATGGVPAHCFAPVLQDSQDTPTNTLLQCIVGKEVSCLSFDGGPDAEEADGAPVVSPFDASLETSPASADASQEASPADAGAGD